MFLKEMKHNASKLRGKERGEKERERKGKREKKGKKEWYKERTGRGRRKKKGKGGVKVV